MIMGVHVYILFCHPGILVVSLYAVFLFPWNLLIVCCGCVESPLLIKFIVLTN